MPRPEPWEFGREPFHLLRAKQAYVEDAISLERLEELVAHVLRGGYLGPLLETTDEGLDGIWDDGVRRPWGLVSSDP